MTKKIIISSIIFILVDYWLGISEVEYVASIYSIIFWLVTVMFLREYRRENPLCFELFFSIVYFISAFYYQFFYIVSSSEITIRDTIYYNYKSYAGSVIRLYMVGYLFYLLGATMCKKKKYANHKYTYTYKYNSVIKMFLNAITSLLIIGFFFSGGYKIITQYNDAEGFRWGSELAGTLASFAIIFCDLSLLVTFESLPKNTHNIFKLILRSNKLCFVNAFLFGGFLLISGFRSYSLLILIPILYLYTIKIHKLKFKSLISILIIGFLALAVIGATRSYIGGVNLSLSEFSQLNLFLLTRDYGPANLSLFFMLDYIHNHGYTYGSNMLPQLLSVIPFLQYLILPFIHVDKASSVLFTDTWSQGSGLGTSIITDLYYSFGVFGVIVGMFLMGLLLSYLYRRIISKTYSMYDLITYMFMIGNSLFAVRVEYLYILRYIAFSIIFLWILKQLKLIQMSTKRINQ